MFRTADHRHLVQEHIRRRQSESEPVRLGCGPALFQQALTGVEIGGVAHMVETSSGQRLFDLEHEIFDGLDGRHGD